MLCSYLTSYIFIALHRFSIPANNDAIKRPSCFYESPFRLLFHFNDEFIELEVCQWYPEWPLIIITALWHSYRRIIEQVFFVSKEIESFISSFIPFQLMLEFWKSKMIPSFLAVSQLMIISYGYGNSFLQLWKVSLTGVPSLNSGISNFTSIVVVVSKIVLVVSHVMEKFKVFHLSNFTEHSWIVFFEALKSRKTHKFLVLLVIYIYIYILSNNEIARISSKNWSCSRTCICMWVHLAW